MQLPIKKIDPRAKIPGYALAHDAGLDLYALEDTVIPAQGRAIVRTGVAMAIPEGFVGLVWDRSGLASKSGIHRMAGVIDAGYRGEIKIVLLNTTAEDYRIAAGDKVAQLLIQPVAHAEVLETETLPDSERGTRGFGTTGE